MSGTELRIRLMSKTHLGLENRDGGLLAGKDGEGRCYLILGADTFHNTEVFDGLGSVEFTEITGGVYDALVSWRRHLVFGPALATPDTGPAYNPDERTLPYA